MAGEITLQDVVDYGQISLLSTAASTSASAILDGAIGDLEGWLRRPLGIQTFTERYLYEGYEDSLPLQNTPVHELVSVTVDGVSYPNTQFYLASFGLDNLTSRWLSPGSPAEFVVTYTAGIDLARYPRLKWVIARAVLDEIARRAPEVASQTQGGLVQQFSTDGGYSVTFRDPTSQSSAGGGSDPAAAVGIFPAGALTAWAHLRRTIS